MDVLFLVKAGYRRGTKEPLRWSLRTLAHHYSDIGRIVIAGDYLPRYLDPHAVEFVEVPQTGSKSANVTASTRAALDLGLSDPFLWMDDDIYLLADRERFPIYTHPLHTREWAHGKKEGGEEGSTPAAARDIYRWLLDAGFEDPIPCADTHTPVALRPGLLAATLDALPPASSGMFRTPYLNMWDLPYIELPEDPLLRSHKAELPKAWTLGSLSPISWNLGAGKVIRNRYWRPSPYERTN